MAIKHASDEVFDYLERDFVTRQGGNYGNGYPPTAQVELFFDGSMMHLHQSQADGFSTSAPATLYIGENVRSSLSRI
ncbi:hypothetical protein MAR_004866 [Mya arenaria]|uniref:Uncharacterized protein n=1 Tax=Mya arenaria TaxID=6604 RepID=A0ABY7F111_MYAAR|nr:hypothetical protein MAR_004866 [Mya arenaria]